MINCFLTFNSLLSLHVPLKESILDVIAMSSKNQRPLHTYAESYLLLTLYLILILFKNYFTKH